MTEEIVPAATEPEANRDLDITAETCPMTFVRTRLMLDKMERGGILRITCRGEEPRRNIPRSATEQGHAVIRQDDLPDGLTRLWLRKG